VSAGPERMEDPLLQILTNNYNTIASEHYFTSNEDVKTALMRSGL